MPTKAKRICGKHGCQGIFDGVSCTICGVRKREDEHDRLSPSKRGYGTKHNALRRKVFLRDGFICQMCGKLCIEGGEHRDRPHKDHIVPLSKGGSESMANSQTLCGACNSRKSNMERR